ncbi:MAG: ferritin family protein [Spirochaetales bacterium]|nr:ferritin family protein [Leptospiraceae bacterium]MCP5482790.1 ferritin family protein [Spirochaetales bacterium]
MGRLKPVKKTTFLEAVAAAIQHEKEVFEFYLRNAESLPESPVRQLFFQLAEDVDGHINMIRNLYEQIEGGELPNLKILAAVHNFHTTSLQILMRRLDRNTAQNAAGDELEAVSLATREHEDAAEFYNKMADKFEDPNIRNLFRRLANFQDENRMLLESYAAYSTQGSPQSQPGAYWEAEDLDA